jgi:hypothetical protein
MIAKLAKRMSLTLVDTRFTWKETMMQGIKVVHTANDGYLLSFGEHSAPISREMAAAIKLANAAPMVINEDYATAQHNILDSLTIIAAECAKIAHNQQRQNRAVLKMLEDNDARTNLREETDND